MLDLWKIHTTNINMKLVSPIVGLLIVGLLVPYTAADISLKLKNQSYLPPTIQEEQKQQQQHQTFHEDKYANSRYQIFEVHNHYEPPAGNGLNEPTSLNNNAYLPAQLQEEKIHIQHINAPSDFPYDDPNLDASYLSLASDSDADNQQFIVKHETRATAANNNPSHNKVPVPFPSNYQHQFPASPKAAEYLPPQQSYETTRNSIRSRQNVQSSAFQDQSQQFVNNFKGSDYLPPHNSQQFSQQQQNSFNGHQQQRAQQIVSNSNTQLKPQVAGGKLKQNEFQNSFKGLNYLPPVNGPNEKSSYKRPGYLPPHQSGSNQQQQTSFGQNTPFKGDDYLPPTHQVSTFGQNVQYKGPDYLPPNENSRNQQQQFTIQLNNPFQGPDYLPPNKKGYAQENVPFMGPDYLPPHAKETIQQQTKSFEENNSFKGSDYLPPQHAGSGQQQSFVGPDYLPPNGNQQSQYQNVQTNIKSSSFLPSGYISQKPSNSEQAIAELHTLPEQTEQQYKQEVTVGTQIQVSGREQANDIVYGSPKTENPSQSVGSHQAAGYLPPGYDFRNPDNDQQQPINEQESKQQSQKPPPHDFIPSGYDFQKPENSEEAIAQLHSQDTFASKQSQISKPVKTSEYLPPNYDFQKSANSEHASNQLHSINTEQVQPASRSASEHNGGQSYNAAGNLPPGYEFQKPDDIETATNPTHSQSQNSYQTSHNLEHNYNQQTQQQPQAYNQAESHQNQESQRQTYSRVENQNNVQQTSQTFKGSDYLPPVASVAVSNQHENRPATQVFMGPDYLPPVASNHRESVNYQAPDYLPPVTSTQQESVSYKAPDYLPPVASAQSSLQQINQPLVPAFKGQDYLPPLNTPQVNSVVAYQANNQQTPQQPQLKAPEYLPPTPATPSQPIQATYMYPLSSYMTSVKPYERYGSARKPFLEYGIPPTTESTVFANNDVSSMYREPATRPQYYAPAMSYSKNAYNSQTYTSYKQNQYQSPSALNQQTRETLQTFMPKDLRQEISPARSSATGSIATTTLQTTKPASAKIRTVQIINTNAVKTLKVLESLDHDGVKTIKILGHSHELPMGDHRVVKVSSHGQPEQTVKIYNDQQDVTTEDDQLHNSSSNNSYLPPRHKRNPNDKSKAKGRRRI